MATAIKRVIPPPVVIPPPTKVDIVLTLSPAEAQALADLFAFVGGDAKATRRGLIADIGRALSDVGYPTQYPITDVVRIDQGPGVYFEVGYIEVIK